MSPKGETQTRALVLWFLALNDVSRSENIAYSSRQQRLSADSDTFRILVRAVTDYAIYMLDPSGNVVSWNAGAERFKGYTEQEIVGRHFSVFYPPEDIATGLPAQVLLKSATEGKFEGEGWRVRKDGSRFWAHVVIDPVRNDMGQLIGFAKITRDLTERRESQQRLEQAREELLQSQKLEALGQLTGGIAHDFNNLLTAVIGSLELVEKRILDDTRLSSLVANAMQAAQRGATLTQRMLAFARRQDLRTEPTDVRSLVGGMTDLLDSALGPGITVVTRFPTSHGLVLIDRNQLEMAVLNLAVNARDAMPDGGQLAFEAREETVAAGNEAALEAGRYIVLSIVDQGAGMDEETLRRATEPFYTTKGIGKGTGLGLSMVDGLARQMGGRLVLESRAGEGTAARLWLRVTEQVAAQVGIPSSSEEHRAPMRSLSVLSVDDDALVLMNTGAMLEDLGHRTTTVCSGEEALELLRQRPFDLLITDQGMPGMTGVQLIEQARALHPDMRIMLATGYAELPPGVATDVPHVAKPYLQGQLAQGIREAMKTTG